MPTIILRRKAGVWEETDVSFFKVFNCETVLHKALFQRRRLNSDVVQIGEDYLFIWR